MPSYPQAHFVAAGRELFRQPSKKVRKRQRDTERVLPRTEQEIDPDDRPRHITKLFAGGGKNAVTAPPKPRATDPKLALRGLGRRDFWDEALERHDPTFQKPIMVRADLRTEGARSFTGGKQNGQENASAKRIRRAMDQ